MAQQGQPAAKRRKLDFSEEWTVTVESGDQASRRFTVPKWLLIKSSKFFLKCCHGEWNESKARTITLAETESDTFEAYLQWIYTGEVVVVDEDEGPTVTILSSQDDRCTFVNKRYGPLFKLAILADKVDDKRLRNAVVDKVLGAKCAVNVVPAPSDCKVVYETLPPCSELRRLIIDFFTHCDVKKEAYQKHLYPADFFFDVVVAIQRRGVLGNPPQTKYADRCDYHEHDEELPKCA